MISDVEITGFRVLNDGVVYWGGLSEVYRWVSVNNGEVSWLVFSAEWLDLGEVD